MRKLASIRIISEIRPHTNADALEIAVVDGWQVVIRKGEFQANDMAVYCEIDSWLPHELAPFLSKGKEPREFEGVKGERLRTIKLRGELSQGLLLPLSVLPAQYDFSDEVSEGDVTELLNVKKWEKPINPQLAGMARGNFPSFIRKTDQERIQNIYRKLTPAQMEDHYEITLKLDGSSMTAFVKDGDVGVCSRNLELKIDDSNSENAFVKMFNQLDLGTKLHDFWLTTGRSIAIQGELWGFGINGNWEGIADQRFSVFDVYDIDKQKYLPAHERHQIVEMFGLTHTPVCHHGMLLGPILLENLLAYADIQSLYNKIAEGIVFKSLKNPDFSFKVINNKYLLSGGN